ncbi:hypothetical protein EVAR_42708_1 [Eumeta japonica]|uniref:Uncharacterized protein n=1 Tax=Eumeta variegata TaxID=151549 RepID=A0A4C1X2L0_EUMVA|nr:hypothetical protein EVAR_42708_1 [Eumeta japonica]
MTVYSAGLRNACPSLEAISAAPAASSAPAGLFWTRPRWARVARRRGRTVRNGSESVDDRRVASSARVVLLLIKAAFTLVLTITLMDLTSRSQFILTLTWDTGLDALHAYGQNDETYRCEMM